MIILGIDPGSVRIGYGLLEARNGGIVHKASGLLTIPNGSKTERLAAISKSTEQLLAEARPDRVGVEKLFFTKNQKTAFEVAEARGVIVTTIVKAATPIIEFTPSEVKLAVTGDGRASKEGVAKMVRLFLHLPKERVFDDVTDALAIAIAASGKRY